MSAWSAHEEQTLVSLAGRPHKEISRAIPTRSPFAIGTRLRNNYKLFTRLRRTASQVTEALIEKHQVCDYYEAGWRFAGFAGELCRMEWRGKGDVG